MIPGMCMGKGGGGSFANAPSLEVRNSLISSNVNYMQYPSGVQPGDLIILGYRANYPALASSIAGWRLYGGHMQPAPANRLVLGLKLAVGTESGRGVALSSGTGDFVIAVLKGPLGSLGVSAPGAATDSTPPLFIVASCGYSPLSMSPIDFQGTRSVFNVSIGWRIFTKRSLPSVVTGGGPTVTTVVYL